MEGIIMIAATGVCLVFQILGTFFYMHHLFKINSIFIVYGFYIKNKTLKVSFTDSDGNIQQPLCEKQIKTTIILIELHFI
jgi:hypothetical protein